MHGAARSLSVAWRHGLGMRYHRHIACAGEQMLRCARRVQLRRASSIQIPRSPPSTSSGPVPNASENPRDIQLAWQQQGATGPPPPPRRFRAARGLLAAILYLSLGAGIATAIPLLQLVRETMKLPTDEQTLTMFTPEPGTHAHRVETYIQSHPLTRACLADPELRASRPHLKVPASMREANLTSGTLIGEGKLEVPPLAFSTRDGSRYVSIQYVGPGLSGHPGIVHGGLLATLLDEGLARCCFPALPNGVGVTASLKMDYLKPCMAGQYIVLRAETTKVEGRKAWVTGWIETLPGPEEWEAAVEDSGEGDGRKKKPVRLVSAEALFIEPKKLPLLMKAYASKVQADDRPKTPSPPSSSGRASP